jgi:uncharacterized protein (TIGR03435 family)
MKTCFRVFCSLILLAGLAAFGASPCGAQQSQVANGSSFGRIEIRPDTSPTITPPRIAFDGSGLHAANMPVRWLILYAYALPYGFQLQGGPAWVATKRYDIDATGATGAGAMDLSRIQSLLKTRFGLATHTEHRRVQVLALEPAAGGAKLRPGSPLKGPGIGNPGDGVVEGRSATMAMLVQKLQSITGTIVLNGTGLAGQYDFTLHWDTAPAPNLVSEPPLRRDTAPASPAAASLPSLQAALESELGLTLKLVEQWADVTVIDRIEQP